MKGSCRSPIHVAYFVSNFVAMAKGVSRGRIFCHHSIARPQQPPTECKDLGDISHTNWIIVYFVSNFVAMATEVGRGGICLTSFNSTTPKNPCCMQESRKHLLQKSSYCLFCFKFSLPWQQGLVVVEFVWHHSIARTQKPPAACKNLGDITQAEI